MNWYTAGISQHNTHRELAGQGEHGSPLANALGLDAIIVPGTRPAAYLDHAVTLARAAKCSLVILCSHYLYGREVKEYLEARSFSQAIVIDLPAGYSHPLFNFRRMLEIKDQLPSACSHHVTDLSMKRNIGLVLAKMLGWRRIFFLDDDIRDITYPDLQRTVDMLGSFSAAGMWVTEFPDNSIVCHANRVTGGSQDVFVSGAALAVDCKSDIGFFPDIYNEDWLFFFDAASKGRLGNSYLKATQLYYYPFANADRAAWQEFGDVLAEGLYALLHRGMNITHASPRYWSLFREARRDFLEAAYSRAENAPLDIRYEMTAALHSALKCLAGIDPDLLARYVDAWRQDLKDWKRRWTRIPVMSSAPEALAMLGLAITPADSTRRILHPLDRANTLLEPGPVIIPKFDTLRKMQEHYPAAPFGTQDPDENWQRKYRWLNTPAQRKRHLLSDPATFDGAAHLQRKTRLKGKRMGEPIPSPTVSATAELARRLRELRSSQFPGVRLKQGDVAQALSGEDPVAVSTLSAWENPKKPTLPPKDRLAAYARFFATARSLEDRPHLLPLRDLTDAEDEARRGLERELFRLRDQGTGETASHEFWRFDDGAPITIICSELTKSDEVRLGPLSDVDNPNYTRLFSFADADALVELIGHLNSSNPTASITFLLASQVTRKDLINHIVLLGGIAWNDVTRRLNASADLPVRQVNNEKIHSGEVFEAQDGAGRGQLFLPRFQNGDPGTAEKPGVLFEDVAMLGRAPNPFNALRTLTYCNGIHSRGVLGAVRCLIDGDVRDANERYIEETFPDTDRFVVLMRVQVLGGETISPSLRNPGAVLFKWPEVEK